METPVVVIKVKYGDMLRRFKAQIVDDALDLNMVELREKILSLFNFAPETEVVLTYVDEDGDVVTLADDDDLHDIVRQALNPLRITVKLNAEKKGSESARSSGASTPLRSPRVQQPFQNLYPNVSEVLRSVPEPLRESFVKLSTDLASKASSSAPGVSELLDSLSKIGLHFVSHFSESQQEAQSSSQNAVPEAKASNDNMDSSKVDLNVVPNARPEVPKVEKKAASKKKNVNLGGMKASSSKQALASGAVLPPLFVNVNNGNLGSDSSRDKAHVNPKLKIVPPIPSPNEKVSDNSSSSANLPPDTKNAHAEEVNNSGQAPVGPKFVNAGTLGSYPWPSNWKYTFQSGSRAGGGFLNECPFSGVPLAPPVPSRKIMGGSASVFHRGIRCDGCGVYPITGPRFKSKVQDDYDLCGICFGEMGNNDDYIRIDHPMAYRHPYSFKGSYHPHNSGPGSTIPQISRSSKAKSAARKLDSCFIGDVTIMDETVMAPLTPFTKIWRLRNNGSIVWPQKTQLVWVGGDKLSNSFSVEVEIPAAGLPVDQELDVAVDFIAPEHPGRYISYWRMSSPSGQLFGQRVWVLIHVDASVEELSRESVRGLNLNLPPSSNSSTSLLNVPPSTSSFPSPKIINPDPEAMGSSYAKPDNSKKAVELVEPIVDMKPNNEQEMNFPINNSLLVGSGASSSAPSAPSSSVSYPIIDLSDVGPVFPSPVPFVFAAPIPSPPPPPPRHVASAPAHATSEKNEMEDKLLRELEDMGFKQVDLNKEILRMNEYDLGQSVDDLCGVAEWDPILEELQEMGFNDTETNKKLLKKNNGSIKRVVMDLIAGEE